MDLPSSSESFSERLFGQAHVDTTSVDKDKADVSDEGHTSVCGSVELLGNEGLEAFLHAVVAYGEASPAEGNIV